MNLSNTVCLVEAAVSMLTVLQGDTGFGETKSLMEQLRGEALKFHKPGTKRKPEPKKDWTLCCKNIYVYIDVFLILTWQEKITQLRVMWSHQTQ